VPLGRCKFTAKLDYEYLVNFKVLQNAFDKHKIENSIPVERLAKCKFQDNLEFLQWMKKFWDQYYPGGTYDAMARRGAGGGGPASGLAKPRSTLPSSSAASTASASSSAAARPRPAAATTRVSTGSVSARTSAAGAGSSRLGGGSPSASHSPLSASGSIGPTAGSSAAAAAAARREWEREKAELEAEYQRMLTEMTQQSMELKLSIEQVEKEREFYFGKLREIEIFVQTQMDAAVAQDPAQLPVDETLRQIQGIMYKTEEGFEIPAEGVDGEGLEDEEEAY
ncbi:hypothetical protein HK405_016066, partial [Cladochytrium tenue]